MGNVGSSSAAGRRPLSASDESLGGPGATDATLALIGPYGCGKKTMEGIWLSQLEAGKTMAAGAGTFDSVIEQPTLGWRYTNTVMSVDDADDSKGKGFIRRSHYRLVRADACAHGSGCRPRDMWPILRTVLMAWHADAVLFTVDWRFGHLPEKLIPFAGSPGFATCEFCVYGSGQHLSSRHEWQIHRQKLFKLAGEERARLMSEKESAGLQLISEESGGQVVSVADGRGADEQLQTANTSWPFFLTTDCCSPAAFGHEPQLNRVRGELEWLHTWLPQHIPVHLLLLCDTIGLAIAGANGFRGDEHWTTDSSLGPLTIDYGLLEAPPDELEGAAKSNFELIADRELKDKTFASERAKYTLETRVRALLATEASKAVNGVTPVWIRDSKVERAWDPRAGDEFQELPTDTDGPSVVGLDLKGVWDCGASARARRRRSM